MAKGTRKRKTRKQTAKEWLIANKYCVLLLAILVYALAYSVKFVQGPSFYGDDTAYANLAWQINIGQFMESQYIFSLRLLQIFPIALFYKLFGVTLLSSAAWDIICFLGTILVIFYFCKEIYSKKVGVLAALLFSFFPLVVKYSTTMSDNLAMMFITAASLVALFIAVKRNSPKHYIAAGLLFVASPLTSPEGVVTVFAGIAYLVILLLMRKIKFKSSAIPLGIGIMTGLVLLMIANLFFSGNPFITIISNLHFYSAVGQPGTIPSLDSDPWFYIDAMFPYNIANAFEGLIHGNSIPNVLIQIYNNRYNEAGFFFYAVVLASAYLLLVKEKRSYYPIFWLAFGFLYLEFGPMHVGLSPPSYIVAHRLIRFLMLIAVPVVIIIAMALVRAVEAAKRTDRRLVMSGVLLAVTVFLIVTSIPTNIYWYKMTYTETYDQYQIGMYLRNVSASVPIYFVNGISNEFIYMGFINESRFYAYDSISNCHDIPQGSYVVEPSEVQFFNLNYTPNPLPYCPYWRLVLKPMLNASNPNYVPVPQSYYADLYYVQNESQ